MGIMIMGSPLWALVVQSDGMTWFILLLLLTMSIGAWTVALQKLFLFRRLRAESDAALCSLRLAEHYDEASTLLRRTPFADLVQVADRVLHARLQTNAWLYDELQLLRDAFAVPIIERVDTATSYTVALRVIAEAAPLLGLLGTIWGLIHSFVRISAQQSADIVTVAPGIAEALITTLMGLFVAIPALLFFHSVQHAAEQYEESLYRLSVEIERLLIVRKGV